MLIKHLFRKMIKEFVELVTAITRMNGLFSQEKTYLQEILQKVLMSHKDVL